MMFTVNDLSASMLEDTISHIIYSCRSFLSYSLHNYPLHSVLHNLGNMRNYSTQNKSTWDAGCRLCTFCESHFNQRLNSASQ